VKNRANQFRARELLLDWALGQNLSRCSPPLPEEEVVKLVGSCWRYIEQGRLLVPGCEPTVPVPRSVFDLLKGTGALDLYVALWFAHAPSRRAFSVDCDAMEEAGLINRSAKTIRTYLRRMLKAGLLKKVGGLGVAGSPFKYRFVALAPRPTDPDTGV
jgi:hypothetical protein